jgi:hypothetical protein
MANTTFTKEPYTIEQQLVADAMYLSRKSGKMNAIIEVDITDLRKKITAFKKTTGQHLSTSTVFLYCYAQTLAIHKRAMALRSCTNQLYIFNDADIFFPYEVAGQRPPAYLRKHIFKSANQSAIVELEKEWQSLPKTAPILNWYEQLFMYLPRCIRYLIYRVVMALPTYRKSFFGNVFFSTVSGTHFTNYTVSCFTPHFHTMGMLVGSTLVTKHGNSHTMKVNLHISADHAIINGIDFHKFTNSFLKQVEAFTI